MIKVNPPKVHQRHLLLIYDVIFFTVINCCLWLILLHLVFFLAFLSEFYFVKFVHQCHFNGLFTQIQVWVSPIFFYFVCKYMNRVVHLKNFINEVIQELFLKWWNFFMCQIFCYYQVP